MRRTGRLGVGYAPADFVDRDAALERIEFRSDLFLLEDRQLVIEAVVEDEAIKTELFDRIDRIVTDPDAILAVETIGTEGGMSLWTREDLTAYPFLGLD